MAGSAADVTNWMHLFRWIVKAMRDEYGIDEKVLVRTAELETDLGLTTEQVEQVLEWLQESFVIRFPDGALDEVVRLEELCLLASWLKGLYKQPTFIGDSYAQRCRELNPAAA
ncbi:MAG TPA: acyl carrier protein [Stellaceae bacterium]|nr:acyl carrier protein [Stellaceae bacterium]